MEIQYGKMQKTCRFGCNFQCVIDLSLIDGYNNSLIMLACLNRNVANKNISVTLTYNLLKSLREQIRLRWLRQCNKPRHGKTCFLHIRKQWHRKAVRIRNFKPLATFCGCTARFVSDLVGNAEDRFSHDEAQI